LPTALQDALTVNVTDVCAAEIMRPKPFRYWHTSYRIAPIASTTLNRVAANWVVVSRPFQAFTAKPREVMAGIKGGRFESYTVRMPVYATGWDGTIRIDFSLNRDFRTRTEETP
jgi:hypothetical protein